ncbi:MAG: P-loop NTPase fold protein, partial [Hyphomicrobiaceae bacterium]
LEVSCSWLLSAQYLYRTLRKASNHRFPMRFLPPEPEVILYETVFDNDILGRESVSKSLSALLDRIEDPLVIALDGPWGSGKSYFLKRWVGAHREQNNGKALTLYFDAFANDYLSDPMVALLSALTDRIPAEDACKLKQLKTTASKFVKPLARIGLSMITFGAKATLDELGGALVEASHSEARNLVDDFWSHEEGRQKAMQDFRVALTELIEGSNPNHPTPLVIVIDELDRCRPDYALEILEVVKHFFAVPMVHFVLGVNLASLENSVKARYGPEADATAYLQKFISLTFTLPDEVVNRASPVQVPAVLAYAKSAAQNMGFKRDYSIYFEKFVYPQLKGVIRRNRVSIRDVGKILGAVAILPSSATATTVGDGRRYISSISSSMLIARVVRKDVFSKMLASSLTNDELRTYLDATPRTIDKKSSGGSDNPDYHEPTWELYQLWQLILSDGVAKFDGAVELKKSLGQFCDLRGFGEIPKIIFDDWLNNFEFLDDT